MFRSNHHHRHHRNSDLAEQKIETTDVSRRETANNLLLALARSLAIINEEKMRQRPTEARHSQSVDQK
jgi:hypothetical protein